MNETETTTDTGQAEPEMIPRSEAKAAFAARDQAKQQLRAVAAAIGLDPASIKVVPTGDAENPFKLEADGLDDVLAALGEGRKDPTLAAKVSEQQRLASDRKIAALERHIESMTIDSELRMAFKSQGAIDLAGDGKYTDLLTLVRPYLRTERVIDPSTGDLQVVTTAVDAKGNPIVTGNGTPCGLDHAVERFLKDRPALKRATAARGPGAGGYGNGTLRASGPPSTPENLDISRGTRAGDAMFGAIGKSRQSAGELMFGKIGRR